MTPTIGRIVHFHGIDGPCAAIITFVWPDSTDVALLILNHDATTCRAARVHHGAKPGMWDWPPRA